MNGSGKQSFYEIQLSNSSLIMAFLVAVGLGVAVFMLGVMVGRGQAPQALPDGGFAEALGPEEGEDATATAELGFHERVQEPVGDEGGAGGDQPAAAGAGTADEDTAGPVAEAAPEPEGRGSETAAAQDDAEPDANGLPDHDPAMASGHVIQVKSTPDRSAADNLQVALASAGFPAFVVSADVGGSTTYRVRVGRYRNRADAERVAAVLGDRSDVDATWVTEG